MLKDLKCGVCGASHPNVMARRRQVEDCREGSESRAQFFDVRPCDLRQTCTHVEVGIGALTCPCRLNFNLSAAPRNESKASIDSQERISS